MLQLVAFHTLKFKQFCNGDDNGISLYNFWFVEELKVILESKDSILTITLKNAVGIHLNFVDFNILVFSM